jgi:hypothetical protein
MTRFNNWLAINGTRVFGTMWLFYVFALYGFLAKWKWFLTVTGITQDDLLYWSNWVQLWALPLLMVGTNLLSFITERLIKETHDTVMEELKLAKEERAMLKALLKDVMKGSAK